VETKQSVHKQDTANILHNRITVIDSGLFNTSQGDTDPMTLDTLNRTGDEVNLRGLSIRFLLEMHQAHSDVTFRAMIIKAAKGDTPTLATLFTGLSTCKILDQINTERYSVIYSKTFKVTARNAGVGNQAQGTYGQTQGVGGPTTGTFLSGFDGAFTGTSLGRAVKVMKIWIPGSKLFKNGVVKYENASTQTKFFGYHFIVYSYINTEADTGDAGTVLSAFMKHYICQMYFKDA